MNESIVLNSIKYWKYSPYLLKRLTTACIPRPFFSAKWKMFCFCATTGQSIQVCRGRLKPSTSEIQRCGSIPPGKYLCQFHCDRIRRKNNRCSCPSDWGHSKSLHIHPIPKHYQEILDHRGENVPGYLPGTKWCNKCRDQVIKHAISSVNSTLHPTKKQKVSLYILIDTEAYVTHNHMDWFIINLQSDPESEDITINENMEIETERVNILARWPQ